MEKKKMTPTNQIFTLFLMISLTSSFSLNQAFASIDGGLCDEWAKKSLKWAEICYRDNKGKK